MDKCFIRGREEIGTILLKESQLMYDKMDKDLNETIKSAYLENSEEIKNGIISRNLTSQTIEGTERILQRIK